MCKESDIQIPLTTLQGVFLTQSYLKNEYIARLVDSTTPNLRIYTIIYYSSSFPWFLFFNNLKMILFESEHLVTAFL